MHFQRIEGIGPCGPYCRCFCSCCLRCRLLRRKSSLRASSTPTTPLSKAANSQACIVTTAIISPPAPEIVNFQLLMVLGRPAFKVTVGDVDWAKQSSTAKRISDADFSTAQFNHPNAFTKKITTEGQLVGMLIGDVSLGLDFLHAFFGGGYLDTLPSVPTCHRDRTYYIEQAPSVGVADTFAKCLQMMAGAAR